MKRIFWFAFCILLPLVLVASSGCSSSSFPESKRSTLILGTTTSVQDSGILDEFVKRFEAKYPYRMKAVAVGSGAALFMGRNGDADVMLTHEPIAEKEFMQAGYGEDIQKVMHNDFILVGPANDPARIRGFGDAAQAFKKLAGGKFNFVSRGDGSGTNMMELAAWGWAGVKPSGSWYYDIGQGMGEDLRVAEDKQAYTLTDRASYIVMQKGLSLKIMVEGDKRLFNQYSVTVVNPKRFSRVNSKGARAFADFLLQGDTQKFIRDFGWDRYHLHLFYPES